MVFGPESKINQSDAFEKQDNKKVRMTEFHFLQAFILIFLFLYLQVYTMLCCMYVQSLLKKHFQKAFDK